jgi:hypothetical protein
MDKEQKQNDQVDWLIEWLMDWFRFRLYIYKIMKIFKEFKNRNSSIFVNIYLFQRRKNTSTCNETIATPFFNIIINKIPRKE